MFFSESFQVRSSNPCAPTIVSDSFARLPRLSSFVKSFFRFLFDFFSISFRFRLLSLDNRLPCRTASLDYHALPTFVNPFFPIFFAFCKITAKRPDFGMTSMHFPQASLPAVRLQAGSLPGNRPDRHPWFSFARSVFYSRGPDTTTRNGPSSPSGSISSRPRASSSARNSSAFS